MKILFYSTKDFEKGYLETANSDGFKIHFTTEPLSPETVDLAQGYNAISIFANDDASAPVIQSLKKNAVKYIAVRAAGYDNVDIDAANKAEIVVANVPDYSPYSIAEHSVLMMLALNRKIILSNQQTLQQNFTLDKLVGFDLHQKKIGIIGTGKIGGIVAKILHGFGCTILAHDVVEDPHLMSNYDVHYVALSSLLALSDIITLHIPLTKQTKYLINKETISQMKKGVMVVNTARGAIINTEDLIDALERGHIGYCGMDVYEKEKGIFFYDHSNKELNDPLLSKLMSLPNVLITPHQAFATQEALNNIAATTFKSFRSWYVNDLSEHELTYRKTSERLVS